MAQSEVIKLLQQYVLLLNTSGIPVNKAFLYGSYSLNNANKNSDIDIMIVSEMFDVDDIDNKIKTWRIAEQIDLRIEPYIIGLKKFINDNVSPLLQIVKKNGIEIKLIN